MQSISNSCWVCLCLPPSRHFPQVPEFWLLSFSHSLSLCSSSSIFSVFFFLSQSLDFPLPYLIPSLLRLILSFFPTLHPQTPHCLTSISSQHLVWSPDGAHGGLCMGGYGKLDLKALGSISAFPVTLLRTRAMRRTVPLHGDEHPQQNCAEPRTHNIMWRKQQQEQAWRFVRYCLLAYCVAVAQCFLRDCLGLGGLCLLSLTFKGKMITSPWVLTAHGKNSQVWFPCVSPGFTPLHLGGPQSVVVYALAYLRFLRKTHKKSDCCFPPPGVSWLSKSRIGSKSLHF